MNPPGPPAPYTIKGVVKVGGTAKSGVTVALMKTVSGVMTSIGTTTTDATGSFSVSGLAEGMYDLRITPPSASGYLVTAFCGASITASSGIQLQLYFLKPN